MKAINVNEIVTIYKNSFIKSHYIIKNKSFGFLDKTYKKVFSNGLTDYLLNDSELNRFNLVQKDNLLYYKPSLNICFKRGDSVKKYYETDEEAEKVLKELCILNPDLTIL